MASDTTAETAPAVKPHTRACGIYTITNTLDGKVYVGSSRYLRHRLCTHRWKLRLGNHDNIILQRAWNRDGEAAFRFEIAERCDVEDLLACEQAWIDKLRARSDQEGYNLCPVAGTVAGIVMPESHRASARARFLGIPKSAEHRAKIGAAQKGKLISDEQAKRARETTTAYFSDPENRKRASEKAKGRTSNFKGRTHSPESIAKMQTSHRLRLEGIVRKPRKSYYKPVPEGRRKNTGPAKGSPRKERRKLTDKQIRGIRRAREQGDSIRTIARRFAHDGASIHHIVTRKTYADVL